MKFYLLFCIIFFASCLLYEETNEEDFNTDELFESTKNESLKSSMCLSTEAEAKEFISKNNIVYNDDINQHIKFIVGKCNPIVLIPGIYSTRLKVRINCKELRRDEESLYNKIKLFCNKYVCSSDNDQEENRDL